MSKSKGRQSAEGIAHRAGKIQSSRASASSRKRRGQGAKSIAQRAERGEPGRQSSSARARNRRGQGAEGIAHRAGKN